MKNSPFFAKKNNNFFAVKFSHCEHGQSRSAAIAAAIMKFGSKNGIKVFAHDDYYPYKFVFRKTLKALKEF